jgi:hypothetical protein
VWKFEGRLYQTEVHYRSKITCPFPVSNQRHEIPDIKSIVEGVEISSYHISFMGLTMQTSVET